MLVENGADGPVNIGLGNQKATRTGADNPEYEQRIADVQKLLMPVELKAFIESLPVPGVSYRNSPTTGKRRPIKPQPKR